MEKSQILNMAIGILRDLSLDEVEDVQVDTILRGDGTRSVSIEVRYAQTED